MVARRGYVDLLLKLADTDDNLSYYDVFGKLRYRLNDKKHPRPARAPGRRRCALPRRGKPWIGAGGTTAAPTAGLTWTAKPHPRLTGPDHALGRHPERTSRSPPSSPTAPTCSGARSTTSAMSRTTGSNRIGHSTSPGTSCSRPAPRSGTSQTDYDYFLQVRTSRQTDRWTCGCWNFDTTRVFLQPAGNQGRRVMSAAGSARGAR